MGSKRGLATPFIILIVLVVILLIAAGILVFTNRSTKCFPTTCTTESGEQGINGCTVSGERTGCVLPISLNACSTRDGSPTNLCRYENNQLTTKLSNSELSEGDLIVFDVNLQKAVQDSGTGAQSYIVCSTSDIQEINEVYVPDNYEKPDKVNGLFCTPLFSVNDYHHLSVYGKIEQSGKVNLATLYLFTEDLGSTQSFYDNLNKGQEILNIEVDI